MTLLCSASLNRDTVLRHPAGSNALVVEGDHIVQVPGSAGVVLDEELARLWKMADGRKLLEIKTAVGVEDPTLLTELAVLSVAGLLEPLLLPCPKYPETKKPEPAPLVSVVIVTLNGRHHLEECLPSLVAQTYPRIELILVDGGSDDGTAAYVSAHFPFAIIVQQTGNPNFAAGNNQGIAQAKGDLIFLLNNDTVLDPDCVRELVAALAGRANVAGVAAMLRFYDNRPFVNGLGTSLRKLGFAYDLGIGSLDLGQFDDLRQVPFLCFGAALIPRAVFDQVGLIEEIYQFYYEDTDWSYRARAMGFEIVPAPRARVYHKFGASTGALPPSFKARLATRNRLWFVAKNLPFPAFLSRTALYWVDDLLRFWLFLGRRQWLLAAAIARAWLEFLWRYPGIVAIRRQTWRGRQRTEVDLSLLLEPQLLPELHETLPRITRQLIKDQYEPSLLQQAEPGKRHRLLIISPDSVGANMGGVGIRYWELAKQLAQVAEVTLAVPGQTDLKPVDFTISTYQQGGREPLSSLAASAEIVLLSGFTVYHHPFLRNVSGHIIVDLYDPVVLENLERFSGRPIAERQSLHLMGVDTFNQLFALGDFFICASEKQRDYWLGALTAANRVNPDTYAADPTLRRLLATVPFGLPDVCPQRTASVLKGTWPGIGGNDKVILWGGGLWDWLDPLTLIEAMPAVLAQVPEARLFFSGIQHPNPDVPEPRMVRRAVELAQKLELKDTAIFFNDWIPYGDRVNYLLEADVGVSLHGNHVESIYAVRTRLMDYLWARVPMVVSGGDVLSDVVRDHGLGRVLDTAKLQAVADALVELLRFPVDPARFEPVIAKFIWPSVAEPLKAYARTPWRNAGGGGQGAVRISRYSKSATPWHRLPAKGIASLRQHGVAGLWRDVQGYLRWLWQH